MNPVLLLHGALGSKTQLEPIRTALEKCGRTVFTMNFSGHSGEPFSPDGFGIEVFAGDVFRYLAGHRLQKADIFGYSMGGYGALWFAFLHPDRVNNIVTLGTKFDWDPQSARREVSKMDPAKILEKVPAFARLLEQRHAPNDWKELLNRTASMMTALGDRPLLDENTLRKIVNPVEIVLGDSDDMADRAFSEQVAAWLPNGRFRLLPDTPHAIEKVGFTPFLHGAE